MAFFNIKRFFTKKATDQEFYSETVSAQMERPSQVALIFLWVVGLIMLMLIFLSLVVSRNTEVIAGGKVTPSLEVRTIESLDQGTISDILVRENEHINKGEVLLRLSFHARQSELAEAISRRYALLGKEERLEAILDNRELNFSDDLKKSASGTVANEQSVYSATLQSFNAQKDVYLSRYKQKTSEKESTLAEAVKIRDKLTLAIKEKNIIAPLVRTKAQPRIKLIQKEREVAIAQTDLDAITASIPQVDAAIRQAQAELDEIKQKQREELSDKLTESLAELAELDKKIDGFQEIMERREVIAPVDGIVQKLYVTSNGNVALAGEPLIDLVPDEESTLITVNINPQDRGQIEECLLTEVNITAFDMDKYGTLSGWVERISPDSIKDPEGRIFFEADIRSNETSIAQNDTGTLNIVSVGMEAKAFIKTGERRILGYVLKPLAKNLKSWTNKEEAEKSGLFNNDCLEKRRALVS